MRLTRGLLAVALISGAAVTGALAQADPNDVAKGWQDSADLSYVTTSGNSETSTIAFKNKLWRLWEKSGVEFVVAGLRSDATTTTLTATRDPNNPNDVNVDEESDNEKTAENYLINGRYDRYITDRFFWFGSAGWDRNEFAGVQNRYSGAAGLGNLWFNSDHMKFRTDYSLTFTSQENVVSDPEFDDKFAGLRLSYDYLHKLGKVTTFQSTLVIDENLEDTSDYRASFFNSVGVTMTSHLALKVGYLMQYDHDPALQSVAVTPPGPPGPNEVFVELDELDTVFTTSLVINY